MSSTIHIAARRHDRAVGNVWASVAVAVPLVCVEAWLLWVALDGRELGVFTASLVLLVMTVSIVGTAAQQATDAGQLYVMTRNAGCLRLADLVAAGVQINPGHERPDTDGVTERPRTQR